MWIKYLCITCPSWKIHGSLPNLTTKNQHGHFQKVVFSLLSYFKIFKWKWIIEYSFRVSPRSTVSFTTFLRPFQSLRVKKKRKDSHVRLWEKCHFKVGIKGSYLPSHFNIKSPTHPDTGRTFFLSFSLTQDRVDGQWFVSFLSFSSLMSFSTYGYGTSGHLASWYTLLS